MNWKYNMDDIQGYLAIIPNDPSGRGQYYATLEAAQHYQVYMNKKIKLRAIGINEVKGQILFNKNHWKEPPLPVEIWTVTMKDKIDG